MSTSERDVTARSERPRPVAPTTEEQAVVRRLSGGFGWPTVFLAVPLTSVEAGMIALWAVATVFMTIGALSGGQRVVGRVITKLGVPLPDSERDRADLARMRRLTQVGLLILVATIPFGWFRPAFLLRWLPTRVGVFYLMILFQWLPHFPFDRTDRFGASRINRFPGSTWLLLQQDRHLIHHLYPQIPWYRYRAAFRELRPLLVTNGAIIQGTGTSPNVPIQLRKLAPAGS